MKKIMSLVLVLVMAVSMIACTAQKPTEAPTDPAPTIASAVELLTKVWKTFPEDAQFPCGGGDEAHMSMEGPAAYEDKEGMKNVLNVPESLHAQITEAASMMHMMNANTFTGAAYKVTGDKAAFTATLKTGIASTQWMCGFPEQLLIATVGDYVVAVYGAKMLVDVFKTQLPTVYEGAQIVVDEPLA